MNSFTCNNFRATGRWNIQRYNVKGNWINNLIKASGGGNMSIDGATDNLWKSKSNVIIYASNLFFVEYLTVDLKLETTANVVEKFVDFLTLLDVSKGIKCVDSFISDSWNGMRDVRRNLWDLKIVIWVYGGAAHFFNNFCEDNGKLVFKDIFREAIYVWKTTKNVSMVRNIFDKICVEKHNRRFSLPLYSKTGWSSINYKLKRLTGVGSDISFILHAVTQELKRQK